MALPPKSATTAKQPVGNLKVGGFIGDACNEHAACRPGLSCLGLYGDGQGAYPQGMCSTICPKDTCFDDAVYPYSRCVSWRHESEDICMIGCNDQGRCDRPGYECDRVDRSDGEGTRYVCVPRPGSAANALASAKVDGTPQPPPGTVSLPDLLHILKGSPAEFGVSSLVPPTRPSRDELLAAEQTAPAPEADEEREAPVHSAADYIEGRVEADAPAAAPRQASADTAARTVVADAPVRSEKDASAVLSVTVIVLVAVITLVSILRMLTTGRFGGVLRTMRDAADDETPLERIRRENRKKRVRSGAIDERPDVRVTRRNPTRPLRSVSTHVSAAREDVPVIPRDVAVARAIVPATPEPEEVPEMTEEELDIELMKSLPKEEIQEEGERLFSGEELSSYVSPRETAKDALVKKSAAPPPVRPADWMAPPDPEHPLMDVGRPLATKIWAGAKAARTFGAPRVASLNEHLPTLIEMDEFVAPLPIDIVLQLLDELLAYAESLRQRKGYEAIVYVETDPRQTWFRRGPEGQLRIQHAIDSFAKPTLAVDVMRRKGFNPTMKVSDAHLLSLVHLGRYLLGSASHDDVMLTVHELSTASSRFSDEERRLVEFLLAPEEHEQLQRLASSRRKETGGETFVTAPPQSGGGGRSEDVSEVLPCPGCASEVSVGDLACRHCGVALHPRPAFCSSCGTRNILLADGSPQTCLNLACGEELLHGATRADVEGRRLSIIAELLSSFDEFRKLPSRAAHERYEAVSQGRRVEVWQLAGDRGKVLVEDDRPQYGLGERITLPHRCVERSGVQFVIYDPPAPQRHPLHSLGGEVLAEQLLTLIDEIHQAKLRVPALSNEDLSVSETAEVCLLHGHVLRSATAPTPRLTDGRFAAPELARQALATERSDLYSMASIWYFVITGTEAVAPLKQMDHEAFIGVPELTIELMKQCLRPEASDRPETARYVLTQLRRRRRLADLV